MLAAARRLRDTGVRVITVGITDKIRLAELKGMATAPRLFEEDYFLVPNAETLTGVISKVAAQACKAKGKAPGTRSQAGEARVGGHRPGRRGVGGHRPGEARRRRSQAGRGEG